MLVHLLSVGVHLLYTALVEREKDRYQTDIQILVGNWALCRFEGSSGSRWSKQEHQSPGRSRERRRLWGLCGASFRPKFTKLAADAARLLQVSKRNKDSVLPQITSPHQRESGNSLQSCEPWFFTSSGSRTWVLLVSRKCHLVCSAVHHISSFNQLLIGDWEKRLPDFKGYSEDQTKEDKKSTWHCLWSPERIQ